MKITINAAAVAVMADKTVAALKRIGTAADDISAAANAITATSRTREARASLRLWRAAAWMDLLDRFTGRGDSKPK